MTPLLQPDYAEMMRRYLSPEEIGDRVVALFAEDDITEVYVNADGVVRVDSRTEGRVATPDTLAPHRVQQFLHAAAAAHELTIGRDNPTLAVELPTETFGGARLQGFVPPVTTAPAFVIRKRPAFTVPLADYVTRGMMPELWGAFLSASVADRQTIIVAGGTGSGKTTLLGALLGEVRDLCPEDRVVVLEDTTELRIEIPDALFLRKPKDGTLAALVKDTLRASPTRIIIGEVRDASALDFLDAAVTGHPGGMCTVHASSADEALWRLDRLAQRAHVPPQPRLVAEAIDLVVTIHGTHATRRVTDIARVDGFDGGAFHLTHLSLDGAWL